jgi:biotin carboxyl carrier protein
VGTDFRLEERDAVVRPLRIAPILELELEGRCVAATLERGSERGEFFVVLDGRRERVFVAGRQDVHYVHWRGSAYRVDAINALDRARERASRTGGAEEIRAPMPGVVVAVAVQAGDAVETGALMLTIESMKLQTAITATHPARIAELCVAAGDHFDQGAVLVRLGPLDGEAAVRAEPRQGPSRRSPSGKRPSRKPPGRKTSKPKKGRRS